MKTIFAGKQVRSAAACALALGVFSGVASAQGSQGSLTTHTPLDQQSLVVDSQASTVMNPFGLCWHTQFGPPPTPGLPCGAPLAQAVIPAPAPYVAPAPARAQYVAPPPAPVVAPALPPRKPRN